MASTVDDSGDDRIGVTLETAARVIGVSQARLRRWAEREIVRPSHRAQFGRRSMWTYSLEDLVVGRVIATLAEREVSMHQIEQVLREIRSDPRMLSPSAMLWATSGREVFVRFPDGYWVGGRQPRQAVMADVLDLDEIRSDARRLVHRPRECAGRTEHRRGRLGSQEVFAGSRVPVATVVAYLRAGIGEDRILRSFPSLYPADVNAVRERVAG